MQEQLKCTKRKEIEMGFVVLYWRDINHMNISFAERDINKLVRGEGGDKGKITKNKNVFNLT